MGVLKNPSKSAKQGKSEPKKPTALESLKSFVFGQPEGANPKRNPKPLKKAPMTTSHSSHHKTAKKADGGSHSRPAPKTFAKSQAKSASQAKPKPAQKAAAPAKAKPAVKAAPVKNSAPSKAAPAAQKAQPKAPPAVQAKVAKPVFPVASVPRARRLNGVAAISAESVCREVACEGLATSGGYCRLHYIKNWKKIKRKEVILQEKKLEQYIEELVVKYPDKYIEAIRMDLASDKDFAKVIYDLDLDETVDDFDAESAENVDSLIDTIKRDFDDETESF